MAAARAQVAALVAVRVDVDDAVLLQLVVVGFGPFRRAEQRRLLAVPRAVDDRALRLPSLLEELAVRARLLELRRQPADRIAGAVHPAVVVIAAHDPLVGERAARDLRDHVVGRHDVPSRLHDEVHRRRAGADAIGDRQRAAPVDRRHRPAERLQQRLGVAVGDRQHRNLLQVRNLVQREPLRPGRRAPARRSRIARVLLHLHHAAALDALLRTIGTLREHVALEVSVVARVGVDQAADGAVLVRELRLDAAPAVAVARDDDLALHADAHLRELLVVLGHAVIRVDERRGDVAVGGIGVEGRQLAGLAAGRILGKRRLLQLRFIVPGRDELHLAIDRCRKEHVELLDLRVEPVRLELLQQPLGILLLVGRADVVRLGGQQLHVRLDAIGLGDGAEFLLPPQLGRRIRAAEAGQRRPLLRDEHGRRGARSEGHNPDDRERTQSGELHVMPPEKDDD